MEQKSFIERNHVTLKAIAIFILGLLLLIPATMVKDLIDERASRKNEVIREGSSKWGGEQTITGPILTVPYIEYFRDSSGVKSEIRYVHFMPEELKINTVLYPEKRHRSLYEFIVYSADVQLEGKFIKPDMTNFRIPPQDILWNNAFVSIGIPDLRGIKEQIKLKWRDSSYYFNPGIETNDVLENGVSTHIPINAQSNATSFSLNIKLRGSERLYFTPTGKETIVKATSAWQTPSFTGAFLPDTAATINEKGFSAEWKVLNLNRNFPQSWVGSKYKLKGTSNYDNGENYQPATMESTDFGVDLLMPVDAYQKTERSAKYAILLIAFTFITFFFIEILNKKYLHPFQYVLVGLALCIFYALLLSLAEYIGFNFAYLGAGFLTISLIIWYVGSILRSKNLSLLIGGTLTLLYGFIFIIIQLEDYALLAGSFGLFIALSVLMFYSRKINWKEL